MKLITNCFLTFGILLTQNKKMWQVSVKSYFEFTSLGSQTWIWPVICFLLFEICLTGCSSISSKPYDHRLVVTYAELALLYEKEKMNNKIVDSLYQMKVHHFFAAKNIKQDEFKKEIEELSKENEIWKLFMQDVTSAMDSLKTVMK